MLEVGVKAPEFELFSEKGELIKLKDYLGKKVVVYFYPKDATPGCTRQACAFKNSYSEFTKKDVAVFGISKDDLKSHQKFKSGFQLPFTLLSDESLETMKAYGVFGEKKLYGKTFLGVNRSTFIIDENGMIEKVFKKANPDTNAEDILKYLNK